MKNIRAGELELRIDQRQAFVGGHSMELRAREFEILWRLAAADGSVVARDVIYKDVWGFAMSGGDRSVDVFVRHVRKKLESLSPGWRYLHAGLDTGYRCEAQPVDLEDGPSLMG